MFGKSLLLDMVNRSAETASDRRAFLRATGLVGLGAVGAGFAGSAIAPAAFGAVGAGDDAVSDGAVLNFALNLEYLEAEFYSYAAFGHGLTSSDTTGTGTRGGVTGGRRVSFRDRHVRQMAEEIAHDEVAHVKFLRGALGTAAVSRPAIDLKDSFTAAARFAGVIGANDTFDPFSGDDAFLLGAYIFEDVGVTAYKGAAATIENATYLEAAAGILAVEAYHAGIIRSELLERELFVPAQKISDARDTLDGSGDTDQGIGAAGDSTANVVPTDANGIAFSRTPAQVLNVVYLTPGAGVSKGGFYPGGLNGDVKTS